MIYNFKKIFACSYSDLYNKIFLISILTTCIVIRSASPPHNVWYLVGGTIVNCSPVEAVAVDAIFAALIPQLVHLGLEVNPSKSELIIVNLDQVAFNTDSTNIDSILGGVRRC